MMNSIPVAHRKAGSPRPLRHAERGAVHRLVTVLQNNGRLPRSDYPRAGLPAPACMLDGQGALAPLASRS
jgi:hypothetical protein